MHNLVRTLVLALILGWAGFALAGDTPEGGVEDTAGNVPGEVTIEDIPAQTIMAMKMSGSYEQHGNAIMQIMMYSGPRGIAQGAPFGQYFNSPNDVPVDSLRWEICVPVAAGSESADPFVVYEMPAYRAAVVTCTGPYGRTQVCYDAVYAYLEENGLEIGGAAQEHWLSEMQTPPEEQQVRIVIPIGKKR